MLELYIECDTNDGDMISSTNKISQETLDKIMPLIISITKGASDGSFKYGDYQTGEQVDGDPMIVKYPLISPRVHEIFEDLCPSDEYGWHTVDTITVCPYVEKTALI